MDPLISLPECATCGALVELRLARRGEKATVPHVEFCAVCGAQFEGPHALTRPL